MNNVKLLHIKCCFFAIFWWHWKIQKHLPPTRKSWNDAPVIHQERVMQCSFNFFLTSILNDTTEHMATHHSWHAPIIISKCGCSVTQIPGVRDEDYSMLSATIVDKGHLPPLWVTITLAQYNKLQNDPGLPAIFVNIHRKVVSADVDIGT